MSLGFGLLVAQQSNIDSLLTILKTVKADTVRINILNKLSQQYIDMCSYEQAIQYAQQAEQSAGKLFITDGIGYKKGMADALSNMGFIYWNQGKYEKALEKSLKAFKIYEEIGDKKGMASVSNDMGLVYYSQGKYDNAIEKHNLSLKIGKEIGDKMSITHSYNNIGLIYRDQGNYEKALDFNLKSLKISEEIGDKKGVASSYNHIGFIYLRQNNCENALNNCLKGLKIREEIRDKKGTAASYNAIGNIYLKQENYQKALSNYLKGLKIRQDIGDKPGLAISLNNIGLIYLKLNDYKKALENELKALKISQEMGDKNGIAMAYNNIGDIYMKQNSFEESSHYLSLSLSVFKEVGNKNGIKETYNSLSDLFNRKGDYKQAFTYHKRYSELKDSLFNEQSAKQITEMGAKYESEKKEKDIALLTKDEALQEIELNKQKFIRNAFVGGLMIVLLLAFVFYNRFIIKKKLSYTLTNKNSELVQKNILIEKQKEKIVDSITYAQRIQQSILMEETEIQNYFPNSFIYFQPKDIVSGDFYWFSEVVGSKKEAVGSSESVGGSKKESDPNISNHELQTTNYKLIIAVVDCAGHGVPGAFMSIVGNTLLNQIINEKHITLPSEIIRLFNTRVVEALHRDKEGASSDKMDISICSINYKNNELEYAGTKNPLYVITGHEIEVINACTNPTLPIKKDTAIYLSSDGYVDQMGSPTVAFAKAGSAEHKKFGIQKFKELLVSNQHLTMQKQKEIIANAHIEWKGSAMQTDDVLVVGIRL